MSKIKVTPEGRKNMWLPEKESLKDYIISQNFEAIHNFIPSGNMMLGADHDVADVLADIDKAERLAVLIDPNANMGHSLALIVGNKLKCYDIGRITDSELEKIKLEHE